MTIEEFRIGFYYKYKGVDTKLSYEVLHSLLDCGGEYNYEPVPLTEEWLLRFGFTGFGGKYELNTGYYSLIWKNDLYLDVEGQWLHLKCEYVHQLQNIYFALTGEEL